MYTIPTKFDLNIFKDIKVIQICFTINTFSLFFEKIGFISIEGDFSFLCDGKKNIYKEIHPITSDLRILKILEKKVSKIYVNSKRNHLTLEFEGNMILELLGNEMYESYVLNINGEKIIV